MAVIEPTWPAVAFEKLTWRADPELMRVVSKRSRSRVLPTYEAAVPPKIAGRTPSVPVDLWDRATRVAFELARFDEAQAGLGFSLPALLLRGESAASSHIERLTAGVGNVALAEITDDVPPNAKFIAGNVDAMRRALDAAGDYSVSTMEAIQRVLVEGTEPELAGLRTQQVWIGGTLLSPHGAHFVPPTVRRVPELLDDLVAFVRSSTLPAVIACAIAHAQFETIHPFADGNGRTGRALMHVQLAEAGVLTQTALPISAGILHNVNAYFDALDAYHEGDVIPIITVITEALESALTLGRWLKDEISEVIADWESRLGVRTNASIRQLPRLLVEHPVVDTALVAKGLDVSRQTATNVVKEAVDLGILVRRETRTIYRSTARGTRPRPKTYYQAADIVDILEELSADPTLLRNAGR